jgi:short-subunit dehydrogenase
MNKKTALITGASTGIGRATAILLNEKGYTVYAGARRTERMKDLEQMGVHTFALDVTNEDSMAAGVAAILEKEKSIDILVNNAGYGSYGAIEDVPLEEGKRQFEVNLFGMARMIQLVLPGMRKNHYGKIINISSMGGKIWTPLGGWYHASKFAVEGFSDCLRLETQQFGIDVALIEPGGVKSEWADISAEHIEKYSGNTAYASMAHGYVKTMKKNYEGNNLSSPEEIANLVLKASSAKKSKTRYLYGFMAKPMVRMKGIIGDRGYDRMMLAFCKEK